MKNRLLISLLFLAQVSAMSQKVSVQLIKSEQTASTYWQILDEQYNPIIGEKEFSVHDSLNFTLEENRRYFLMISVFEVYNPDTSLYRLQLNGEPIILINSEIAPGDHLFPFFTGTRTRQVKITGGTTALISEFPWQVYLIADRFQCGGSIINEKWVLTAAHCALYDDGSQISADLMKITVGANNPDNPAEGKTYLVSKVIVHEGYNNQTHENDIALLKIKDSINYPNAVPINLLTTHDADIGAADPGVMAWVTGWGLTKVSPKVFPTSLQKVQLPIVSNETAAAVWGPIPSTDIMAGYRNGTKDACSGDSGGPLIVPVAGGYKLAGIVSWGSETCNTYGAYTRVSLFGNWVSTNTGIPILYSPPAPAGDTIICQGTSSSQYSIASQRVYTSYEWKLIPSGAGVITGNSNNATVLWDITKTGPVSVMVRVTIGTVPSDWSTLKVIVAKNTRLLGQSDDIIMCAQEPVTLFVTSEGYELKYKWYQDNNLVQSGTSNQLKFTSAVPSNSGIYRCEISGACGTVVSKNINLTVYPLTSILSISPDTQVLFGNDVTLNVNSDGNDLIYQWQKDRIDLINENSSQLVLQHVNASDIGLYRVIVKGTCGTSISDSVYVYVKKDDIPSIDVFVWPTVITSIINVALSNDLSYNIQIFSITGRLIKEQTNCHFQTELDLSSLAGGVYIVNVSSGKFRKSIKFIKE